MASLIGYKDLKIFKASYKLFNLKKLLNESSCILFYYYDFLTQKDIIFLKKFMLENNLNYCLLDKKSIRLILKKTESLIELKEIFSRGNIIVIYQLKQNQTNFDFINISVLLKKYLSKITLFGIKLNDLIFKNNKILQIKSFDDLNKKIIVLQLLNTLKKCHNTIYSLR